VLKTQLNMLNVRPDDNVAAIFEDIDFWEIAVEVGEEFGLKITDSVVNNMDGTVDSLIRSMDRLRLPAAPGDAGPPT
jgi:hypothetical protein